MAAYVISEVEILDQELVKTYRALAEPSVAKYGGCYIVRGGAAEVVERDGERAGPGEDHGEGQRRAKPPRLVILEFPTMERARAWYRSPEYAAALKVRRTALKRRLVFVEGA